jgi:hypothetical protein
MTSFNTIINYDGVPTWIGFRSSWMFHPESERASKLSISLPVLWRKKTLQHTRCCPGAVVACAMTSLLSVHRALACRISNASVCSTCRSSRGASTSSLALESIVVSSPSLSFKFVAGHGNSHSAAPRVPLLRQRKGQEGENIRSGVSKRRGCCVAQLGFTADPRVRCEVAPPSCFTSHILV